MLKGLVRKCDLFGHRANLLISSQERYKTLFGGMMTIILIVLSAAVGIYFTYEFFSKSQQSLISSRGKYSDFGPYNFSSDAIGFYIGIEYKNQSYYIDPSIYTISAIETTVELQQDEKGNSYQTFTDKEIPVGRCTDFYNVSDVPETNLILPLNEMSCLLPNSATLRGYWGASIFKGLATYVNKCVNTTKNSNCRTKEEIDETIQGGYFAVYYSQYYLAADNVTSPLQRELAETFNVLNSQISVEVNYNVKPITLNSDDGFIFPSYSMLSGIKWEINYFYHMETSQTVLKFGFGGWSTGNNYFRYFSKVQDILAKASGVVKLLTIVCTFIINFLSKNYFYFEIYFKNLDKGGKVGLNQNEASSVNQMHSNKVSVISQLQKMNNIHSVNVDVFNKKKSIDKMSNLSGVGKQTEFRSKLLLNFYLCRKMRGELTDDVEEIENYKKIVDKSLSVDFLMRKSFEVEVMKEFLFDKESDWNTIYSKLIENEMFNLDNDDVNAYKINIKYFKKLIKVNIPLNNIEIFWNELKLKFKEQLRVVGKFDLNKPNDYLVKRRSFKDIDISKDFEFRLMEKAKANENFKVENKVDLELMTLDQLEEHRERIREKEEKDKEDDIYHKIILTDMKKMSVLATIKTFEFFDKFFPDTALHPETRKNLELIEHHVKYNLPVEKRILFEAMPELFPYEIGKMSEDERTRFRRRRHELVASDGVLTTAEQYEMAILNREYEVDKLNEMGYYHHFAKFDFFQKWEVFLNQALEWGWESKNSYLYSLKVKDKTSLTSIEELMLEELKELDLIQDEIGCLYEAIANREPEFVMPFPMDESYKQEILSHIEHMKKFKTVNLLDTVLVPYVLPEETFLDRLKKIPGVDIEEEIRLSNERLMKQINSGLPIKGRDLNAKDPEVVRQVNIISQAVKVEPPMKQKIESYEIPLDYIEEGMLGLTPTKGRILIEEYYKVLYLNNEDFEKYNFNHWVEYFNVEPTTLRNIFNYVFFPLPDEKSPSEVGKILYFKDFEFEKRRKMIADMSKEDYQEYIDNTETRPELEEGKRLDYLVYQTTSTEPRISERTVPTIDEDIEKRIDAPLLYSEIIKSVDEKIDSLVKGELEGGRIGLLDRDIEIKIEELRRKRLQDATSENKLLEQEIQIMKTKDDVASIIKQNEEVKINYVKVQPEVVEDKDMEIENKK